MTNSNVLELNDFLSPNAFLFESKSIAVLLKAPDQSVVYELTPRLYNPAHTKTTT